MQENIKLTVSIPDKTIVKLKVFQKPCQSSNFGVNSPKWPVGLFVLDITALREYPSNIKPLPR